MHRSACDICAEHMCGTRASISDECSICALAVACRGADNERCTAYILHTIVRSPDSDCRDGMRHEVVVVGSGVVAVYDAGIHSTVPCVGAGFGEVVPAIAILIEEGIEHIRVGVVDGVNRFPPGFHEVMVADEFAEVFARLYILLGISAGFRRGEEVVEHRVAVRVRHQRIERVVHHLAQIVAVRLRAIADKVFLIVVEAVIVRVVRSLAALYPIELLPPIGNAVLVEVVRCGIVGVDASEQQTLSKCEGILLIAVACRPIRLADILRVAVKRRAICCDRPGVFRSFTIPACGETLCEGGA